ncbi:MAG: hypothetical protein IPN42_05115 [Methylococcaceae bacterium]|nr:hypothetical protein [Methylococcaceae bacterium]
MTYQQKDKLFISSLPSLIELERLNKIRGVNSLVNVAGVDIKEIYTESQLLGFTILQYDFADVFTHGNSITDFSKEEKIYVNLYETVSEIEHRIAFANAVKGLKQLLENGQPTLIFCHRGLSRSPLVAASALNFIHDESLTQTIERIHSIQPSAQFTDVGISALLWCRNQLG